MIPFVDTSILCAIYRKQENSALADAVLANFKAPMGISSLVAFEFRQAARLQAFRYSSDKKQGFSKSVSEKMLAQFDVNLTAGAILILPVDWADVHSLAERLSARHTTTTGQRSLDILHVATAIHAGSQEFLTFDLNQAALARAEGLNVLPD